MKACNPDGPVMVQVAKLYHTTDAQSFRAFGRVMSGTLRKGMEVKVLGEGYSPEDEEDMLRTTVDDIWICQARLVLNIIYERLLILPLGTSSPLKKCLLAILSLSAVSMPRLPKLPLLQALMSRRTFTFSDLSNI